MVASKPKSEWLANNAMTIVLAVIAFQQAYNAFNSDTTQRLARLEEWKISHERAVEQNRVRIERLEARGR